MDFWSYSTNFGSIDFESNHLERRQFQDHGENCVEQKDRILLLVLLLVILLEVLVVRRLGEK